GYTSRTVAASTSSSDTCWRGQPSRPVTVSPRWSTVTSHCVKTRTTRPKRAVNARVGSHERVAQPRTATEANVTAASAHVPAWDVERTQLARSCAPSGTRAAPAGTGALAGWGASPGVSHPATTARAVAGTRA